MATAVEQSSEPRTPSTPMSLPLASLIGAVYLLAALALLANALPKFWLDNVTPRIGDNVVDWTLWLPVLAGAVVVLAWFGAKLAGDTAPRGVRAGAFLMLLVGALIFFVVRFVAGIADGPVGLIIGAVMALILLFWAFRFFTGRTARGWMVSLEEQGWFSTAAYKRSLGIRVRRLTILGILIVGGTGIYTLWNQSLLPARWTLTLPRDLGSVTLLYGAQIAIPIVLLLLLLWIAWRAVNVPAFAEFLIATEAEMNKVSWSSRKRLFQDTIVVLVTTLIMTLFLLVVDLFWGWLLSRQTVGVLPGRVTTPEKGADGVEAKW